MARRSLKPQLNQIRSWVHEGRTDAWIAHQLDVSVRDIANFKSEHKLEAGDSGGDVERDIYGPTAEQKEIDLRAEDEALVAAALEEEASKAEDEEDDGEDGEEDDAEDDGEEKGEGGRPRRRGAARGEGDGADGEASKGRRRRGRRGGRGRKRGARKPLEGTFDHGEDGYGLWLDPAIQDDPVYAEHWAGHRPVTVAIEQDQIVISRKS